MSIDHDVFINCPFDEEYFLLLRPLLFTIIFLGFNPRITLESSDCGEIRLEKICELIQNSLYSIHDLSRLKSTKENEYSRLNMPFELGLDMGCRRFSRGQLKNKKLLVLEVEQYRYMRALSDISGIDIKSHDNIPIKLVIQVRNWFVVTAKLKNIPSGTTIWYKFTDFAASFFEKRFREGYTDQDLNMMPIPEYIDYIRDWRESNSVEQYVAASGADNTESPSPKMHN